MIKRAFDPALSATSVRMMNMSDKEIFQRYFVKNNNVSWVEDFNDQINLQDNNKKDVYPRIVTLLGRPLNIICSIINKFACEYIPADYKLNARTVAQDLESILLENTKGSRDTSSSAEENAFIVQLARFFNQTINKGIDYTDTLTKNN